MCLSAQFSYLAVTDDARQIYFVSRLPLRGEVKPGGGIYCWNDGRLESFVDPAPSTPTGLPFHSDVRIQPAVSGGGTVVSWTDEHRCSGGSACLSYPTSWDSTIVTADGQQISVAGRVQISKSGRFVTNGQEISGFSFKTVTRQWRDRETGAVVELPSLPVGVADDGRALTVDNQGLLLWSPSGSIKRLTTPGFSTGLISSDGSRVVAVRSVGVSEFDLVGIDVATGAQVALGKGQAVDLSNDGSRLLVLSGQSAEPFLVNTTDGSRRQLLSGTGGVISAALAGFGQYAVLATGDGRMLRVDVNTGDTLELIPRTPVVDGFSPGSPCSALQITGTNLTGSGDLVVTLDGAYISVLSRSSTQVWVQVPCEALPSDSRRSLELSHNSPFDAPVPIEINTLAPSLISVAQFSYAVHQDFSRPVDSDSPARRGEVVHFWGTGFGPVDHPVPTGEPGPASPLARLVNPVTCIDRSNNASLELSFAGLAPGLVGVYQMDLRVPSDASSGFVGAGCTFGEDTEVGIFFPVELPAP